ncbi:MAG: stage II sporulation protein R [Clostridia bacterium]|nr:stage II sporulation protein R [Clostridia bacterium]MDD4387147.1 stage II sporulation protein R [Clostridia bacterium]
MKNKFKNINIPLTICIFSIILLSLYTSIGLYKKTKTNENYFRLHVVANSDSIDDQIIKLKIADKIENYINNVIFKQNFTKQETYNTIYNNMDEILLISNSELKENNINYVSTAKLGKINYTEKKNIYTTMDEGSYDSIQILLGDAKGKNYWNLIFPNKENIRTLEGLENILPGIANIYTDKNLLKEKNVNNTYSFKFLEIIKNIF